LRFEVRSSKFE